MKNLAAFLVATVILASSVAPVATTGQPEPTGVGSSPAGQTCTGVEPQLSLDGCWALLEFRDSDGNPMLPRRLIATTHHRRYGEVPAGTEIEVRVETGYKPRPLLSVERKLYEVHRLFVHGWRRNGQVAVEVDGWRRHEAEWFDAMRGGRLVISDPGAPGSHSEESEYVILATAFGQKTVRSQDEQGNEIDILLLEAKLDIRETWKSAWRRQGAEVLSMGFKQLLLPMVVSVIAGVTTSLWVRRQAAREMTRPKSPPARSSSTRPRRKRRRSR